jgi:hypothetical protein
LFKENLLGNIEEPANSKYNGKDEKRPRMSW